MDQDIQQEHSNSPAEDRSSESAASHEERSHRHKNKRRKQRNRLQGDAAHAGESSVIHELEQATQEEHRQQSSSRREHNRDHNRDQHREHRRDERREHRPSQQRQYNSTTPSISVVIPMLNEEESLPELLLQLTPVLEKQTKGRYEVIFIDDGSTDSSFDVVKNANKQNSRIRGTRFRRNYGKSAALSVGFAQARYDVVITMDADLQDDPNEIPRLIEKINEGFDLVSGWKKTRHDPLEKRIPSKFFNYVTSTVSGITLHDFNCGLKAYRRDVVKSVKVYGEMHRYIPALAHWAGFHIAELPVQHHARKYGTSKFGFSRYMKGFLDLLTVLFTTRYIKRPLHLFGTIGALFALVGLSIDVYLSIEWAMGLTVLSNRPLANMGIAFIIVGVQLLSAGLLGEMIVKNNVSNEEYGIKDKV